MDRPFSGLVIVRGTLAGPTEKAVYQPLLWTGPRRVGMLFYSLARHARRVFGHRASSVIRPSHLSVSTPHQNLPEWFVHGERLLWPTLALARSAVGQRKGGDLTLDLFPSVPPSI